MNLLSRRPLIALMATLFACFLSLSAEEYTFPVGSFKTLKIQDNVNVIYHCKPDGHGYVKYTGTPDFDDAFILTASGDVLKIQVNTEDVDKPDLPTLHIYSDRLAKVDNYSDRDVIIKDACEQQQFTASLIGNGSITIDGLNTEKLNARVTAGNGKITITGRAVKANFRMTGAGAIDAEGLKVQDVNCKILGGGTIICGPEHQLKTIGIGSTKIQYHGNPDIIHKGGGKLISLDS